MKVIILAAGIGSRLGQNIPKAMVKLNENISILDLQIKNLETIVNSENITIVVGFKKELIMDKHNNLDFVHNSNYKNTNTAKSLLMALKSIQDDDIMWMNGDVVFEADILSLILKYKNYNLICVDEKKLGDEEVKYTLNEKGYINKISKSVKNGIGEAVGINFIKKQNIPLFISCLENCEDLDYFEKAIETIITKGIEFLPLNINNNFCIEVDFKEDLNEARKYITRGIK